MKIYTTVADLQREAAYHHETARRYRDGGKAVSAVNSQRKAAKFARRAQAAYQKESTTCATAKS